MEKKEFKVLVMNFEKKKYEAYDVLPFLRLLFEEWPYNIGDVGYVKVTSKRSLKIWVENKSVNHFWATGEYDFLMASCKLDSYMWREDKKAFCNTRDNSGEAREISSLNTENMTRAGVHEQIKMNIDVIVDILYEEFFDQKQHKSMKSQSPTLEGFSQIYPELLAQARDYAEGTIVNPEENDSAVEACICDFMEGARTAMCFKANLPVRS